jgi:heat shock protein HslJ
MRIHLPTLVAAAAIGLLLPASVFAQSPTPAPEAGSPAPEVGSPAPATPLPLEGMRWHLREYRAEDGGMAGASDGGWIRLQDGALTGSTGCNDLAGSYTLEGATLTFADLTPTEATCLDGDLVAQEMAVVGRLPEVVGYAFETARGRNGTNLVLVDGADAAHLVFESIQGRTWTPMYDGVEAMPEGNVSVRFEDGMTNGQAPCDIFTGPFSQDDLSIAIGPLGTMGMTCADAELEQRFLEELMLATSYAFESGDLVLLDDQGDALRRFTEVRTGY